MDYLEKNVMRPPPYTDVERQCRGGCQVLQTFVIIVN